MKLELTRRSYAVEIPVDQFSALERAEDILGHGHLSDNSLSEQIDGLLRAGRTEYNGHFGNFIFFDMDVEEDTPEMHAQILSLIEGQLSQLA